MMKVNAFKAFEREFNRNLDRLQEMDGDQFVAECTRMFMEDGMIGDITVSVGLADLTRKGSIEAAAALALVTANAVGNKEKYEAIMVEAVGVLVNRSEDMRAGMIDAALNDLRK
jgi:hypothetical protein